MSTKGILLVGGPAKGTRFRPLSLDTPKPLFPIAGRPMIWHALRALASLPNLTEILLIGVYEDAVFADFLRLARRQFPNVASIAYLREYRPLGTAGGLYHFRDSILKGGPKQFFLVNADVGSSFPLAELERFHATHRGVGTLLVKQVPTSSTAMTGGGGGGGSLYGSVVVEPSPSSTSTSSASTSSSSSATATAKGSKGGLAVHYVEKPESFVSDRINAGVYLFDKAVFDEIKLAIDDKSRLAAEDPLAADGDDVVHLEHDVLPLLASAHKLFALESATADDFWLQIKSAGSALAASTAYLEHFRKTAPDLLTPPSSPLLRRPSGSSSSHASTPRAGEGAGGGGGGEGPEIVGAVFIDPSATVDRTAKIGPNVAIGPNVVVEPGARVAESILLAGTRVGSHACVVWSIVGSDCKIGSWARVSGAPELAKAGDSEPPKKTVTILASDVTVAREICVHSCIVLPAKTLTHSAKGEVLL